MGNRTRRLLAVPMMALTAGAGLVAAPSPAQAAGVTGTVEVRSTLMTRSAPSPASRVTGSLRDGQRVTAVCRVTGQTVRGTIRTTAQWDRLSTGSYVSDAYLRISRSLPPCASTTAPAAEATYKIGTVRSADGTVNIRTGPGTSYPVKRSVTTGATVRGVGVVVGQQVNGTVLATTQWNRLSDGGYISHAYVLTPTLHLCPGPAPAPVAGPAITPDQFLKTAVPGAQRGWREYGVPASVTIAQAILESGWGRSGLSSTDRNYFGIKCQNGRYGTLAKGCHDYHTSECDKTGKCFATTASFRIYATMADSFRDHGNFLRVNSRYKPAFGYTRDANKFIWQVWKAGYATDPNYYTKITALMATNDLYRYDIWK